MLRTMAQRLTHDAPAANRFAASGAALLAGTLTANALSYAFFVVLSRLLDAGELGAVGALVNLSVIATVPALGLQLVAARLIAARLASADDSPQAADAHEPAILRGALRLGTAIALALAVLTPALTRLLSVDALAVLALSAAMVPMTLTYAAQGILQGEERFGPLAAVLALSGVSKVVAAVGAAVLGAEVNVVIALYAAATLAVGGLAVWTVRRGRPQGAPATPWGGRHLARLVAAAAVPTSGLLFLASMDVLLARHHLTDAESGTYTVGALFGKAAFWGTSFLATLFYPAMTDPQRRRSALVRALAVTAGAGVAGIALTLALGRPLVLVVGGPDYAALAPDAWRFTAFGVLLALVQVLGYAGVAAASVRMGVAMWAAGVVAVTVTLATATSVVDVVTVMLGSAAALVVAGLVIERRSLTTPG